jgi:hypothetical protein
MPKQVLDILLAAVAIAVGLPRAYPPRPRDDR